MVVSDIPMNKDIVEEGVNGFFCTHMPESIAMAIKKCLPNLETLKAGSIQKASSFSWLNIGQRYLESFERVFEGSRK